MVQTSLMLIILVFVGLWYTRQRATSTKAVASPLYDRRAYVAIFAVALVLALLWH